MKNAIFLLMALVLLVTPTTYAGEDPGDRSEDTPTLTVKGFYKKAACVQYDVYEVDGQFNTLISTDKSFKAYELELTVGTSYMILFTKDDVTKALYITPTEGGEFELDVDFRSGVSAELYYDPNEGSYIVTIVDPDEHYVKAD